MTRLRKQQELALALISLLKKFRINWARHDKTPKEAGVSYNPAVVYLSYWEDSISITL